MAAETFEKEYPNLASRFEFKMKIGHGGQGTVSLVRQHSDQELYACKTFKEGGNASEEIQFLRRMHGCSRVVQLRQVIHDEPACHLILELCDSNIGERVRRVKHLCEKEAAMLLRDLAKGVLALHNRGIVHRDLKLGNVLITAEAPPYSVKVCDLGSAANIPKGSTISTGFITGTTRYVSPEATKGSYSGATDAWGLGIILYECLSGTMLFSSMETPKLQRYWRTGRTNVESKLNWSRVQPEAKDFILQILEVDPQKRLSVSQIIQHPWMLSRCGEDPDHAGTTASKKRKRGAEQQACNTERVDKRFKFQKRDGQWCRIKPVAG